MKRALYFVFILFFAGCSLPVVTFETIKPPEVSLGNVTKIAVAEFEGERGSGTQASYKLTEYLTQTQRFTVLEREKIDKILQEQGFSLTGAIDQATAVEIGKLLGVDALIFGSVTSFKVEDEKGTRKVERKVGTGQYKKEPRYNIFTKKWDTVDVEIKKTVLVDESYLKRKGVVSINFKVVDVKTGQLLAVKSLTQDKKYESVEGKGTIPAEDEILSELLATITKQFAGMIAPMKITVSRELEKGSDIVNRGIKFAQNGLWDKARKTWEDAMKVDPSNPAIYYNLGVAYEQKGDFFTAKEMYSKAVDLNPKEKYMKALKQVEEILTKPF
uniref:Tetratricopeptide repeat protein n=1 Tax=candidate division WOR-3 bacterium TaxID=2052148 RepID=A0A7C4Y5L1_UNCW3